MSEVSCRDGRGVTLGLNVNHQAFVEAVFEASGLASNYSGTWAN